MKRFFLSVLFFAGLILLWELAVRARLWSPVLLPAPVKVVEYLKSAAADGTLWQATLITLNAFCRVRDRFDLWRASCLLQHAGTCCRPVGTLSLV